MKVIIARYGEIHLRKGNRGIFIKQLEKNTGLKVADERIVCEYDEKIFNKLQRTFGITSVSIGEQVKHLEILDEIEKMRFDGTFKVSVNRADRTFEYRSPELNAICGDIILKNNKNAKVDLVNPKTTIYIDIRPNDRAFIFKHRRRGPGGLPVGVSGRGLSLISGGIDSPVSSYLGAKRGLSIDFLHFASPPYTSEQALNKVKKLCGIVANYSMNCKLFVVPFTKIQEEIRKHCKEEYTITIMRRFMLVIAEKFKYDCIITGENLAQVASQTVEGIASNNCVAGNSLVLRPLIFADKEEIIEKAKQIGTYETSILPYEDCCTVFVPRHPIIKPDIKKVEEEEKKLDFNKLAEEAYNEVCIHKVVSLEE
ncbi:MAG: tRNA 4-thiouridine(8) synthase ThiI [Christensenellaceae bacterium]|jgi:thiamine biosynthesis protein ThiI|nr:tRNA 4-thiouridine(8) synthase ThiI [Christensenellaceae bacterium]